MGDGMHQQEGLMGEWEAVGVSCVGGGWKSTSSGARRQVGQVGGWKAAEMACAVGGGGWHMLAEEAGSSCGGGVHQQGVEAVGGCEHWRESQTGEWEAVGVACISRGWEAMGE